MKPERKRVLLLVPSLISGGAQRVFSTLLRHLDRRRFEIHLAVLQATGPYLRDVPQDVTIHDLKVSRIRYAAPGIIRIVWKVRPQAVLSTLVYLNLQLLLVKSFLPSGTTVLVRESTMASIFLERETRHPAMWKWVYGKLHRRADRIICLSDAMKEDLLRCFDLPAEKLVRIHNPLDLDWIRAQAEVGGSPYCADGPHLVTAGRLAREKGFDLLLQAMQTVTQTLPTARLSILGEGPLEAELKQMATQLGVGQAVEFVGFQQNPWPYFKHADVFVLASRYEGLPNALLEALALGVPAVVADCPSGLREIQCPEGQIILAAPESSEALAKAIICQCERAKVLAHANQRGGAFLGQFELQEIVREYGNLLSI
jgi:glycosyltransferase involved in cell wall biosynthesis